jgi:hypothetical protein
MIRKSGNRFSLATNASGVYAKIMLKQEMDDEHDLPGSKHIW